MRPWSSRSSAAAAWRLLILDLSLQDCEQSSAVAQWAAKKCWWAAPMLPGRICDPFIHSFYRPASPRSSRQVATPRMLLGIFIPVIGCSSA